MRDLKYIEYIALQKAFENMDMPKTESETVIHRFIWDVLRQQYKQEGLLPDERDGLQRYFDACNKVAYSDEVLHEYGAHRNLYDYIVEILRFDCVPERGKVYRRAELLLNHEALK